MIQEDLNYNPSLDEIVFEKRNREYGAYDLRYFYRRYLTKAFLLGTSIFVLGIVAPFLYMKFKQLNEKKTEVKVDLVNILDEEKPKDEIKEEAAPPPPPPPKQEEKIEIIQNVVPEPVKAPKVETPPPPIKVQLESTTGTTNQEGVKQTSYAPPPVQAPPRAAAVESKAPSTTEVYESVDQDAEFPGGGLSAFRTKFSENFDTSAMEGGEGTIKATVTFIVERDGSITDIKVQGGNSDFNQEATRTVKSVKTKWKPAKINDQPVRQRYKMPITMNFE